MTLVRVARRARVSPSTVSRVPNDNVRDRVSEIAEEAIVRDSTGPVGSANA